jgi:hypothetical protein
LPAKIFAPVEVPAGLRSVGVNRAKERGGIEGHAGPVAALVHAAHAGMLGDEFLRHAVARPQLHHKVAAAAAAGARGKVGMRVDEPTRAGLVWFGDDGVAPTGAKGGRFTAGLGSSRGTSAGPGPALGM